MENNKIMNVNGEGQNTPVTTEKKGMAKFIDTVIRKYERVRYSKAGRITAKVLTGAGFVAAAKIGYDKGIKSVKPVTVYIRDGVEEPKEEEPAEEATVEEKTE